MKLKREVNILDFMCNSNKSHQQHSCCPADNSSIECLKVLSVICSKRVQKVAEARLDLLDLGIPAGTDPDLLTFDVTADPNNIVMRGTLLEGKVVNSGYVPVSVIISVAGVALPAVSLNLPFQAETECPGACPGDDLQETRPIIEGVLEPVFTPVISIGDALTLGTLTFKVIIRTQITVSREKLVEASVKVIGDINEDRCVTDQITTPTSQTRTFFG